MLFALTAAPILLTGGAGIDLARALAVRSKLYTSVDAAALAVGSKRGLSQTQANALAQQYFDANYQLNSSFGQPNDVNVLLGDGTATVTVYSNMPTTLMGIAGFERVNLSASSTVVWGKTKIWVGLALDNTGSMCQSDTNKTAPSPCPNPTADSKIAALKVATKELLSIFKGAAATAGDVRVSLTPFAKDVNVGATNVNQPWIDWSAFGAADHSTWNGCVTDRGDAGGPSFPAYDTSNAAPNANAASKFTAEQYGACPRAITSLSFDWNALNYAADQMTAAGNTNQTIGLAWAWHSLSQNAPALAPALPNGTERHIIILSDGENTQNRWTKSRNTIDARMNTLCANARTDDITIWAVFVNIAGTAGNAQSMKDCATGGADGGHYIEVTSTDGIGAAFDVIGQRITNLRVAQ